MVRFEVLFISYTVSAQRPRTRSHLHLTVDAEAGAAVDLQEYGLQLVGEENVKSQDLKVKYYQECQIPGSEGKILPRMSNPRI